MKRLFALALSFSSLTITSVSSSAQPAANNDSPQAVGAGTQPAATEVEDELTWPREKEAAGTKFLIYQPQLETWQDNMLKARCAIAITPPDATGPQYCVAWVTARTDVDKGARLVTLDEIKIDKITNPKSPDNEEYYKQLIDSVVVDTVRDIPLDHLEANLTATQAATAARSVPVKNTPPIIYFTEKPAMLVLIDGDPRMREVAGTRLMRVLNTRAGIFQEPTSGMYFLHAMGKWHQSTVLKGVWATAERLPDQLERVFQQLVSSDVIDPLDPQEPDAVPKERISLLVSTMATELIQTRGPIAFTPIEGTKLQYANNTDSAVFKLSGEVDQYFVLISGRWFSATSTVGPWSYVDGKNLPAEFQAIPTESPKANVRVSVAGTSEASEAVIANSIPQTAAVKISETTLSVTYDGEPVLNPIEGVGGLSYVVNCALPVIRIDADGTFWCVDDGVWFAAKNLNGPWVVATSVPEIIYTIPASSPLHYVTYVRVYDVNDDIVYVGYTPGYMGTCVTSDGVVVYGTGYYYPPYVGDVWVGYPVTYGYGAGFAYGSMTGFAFGFAAGAIIGDAWSPPYWGACGGWGYAHVDINSSNVYRNWRGGVTATAHHYEYDSWDNEIHRSGAARTFNPYTGRSGSAGYSSYYNYETNDYNFKAAGSTYDRKTGTWQAKGVEVDGDLDSGNIDVDRSGARLNTRTDSGFAYNEDNIYAGNDGNVYRYDREDGSLQKREGDDWEDVDRADVERPERDETATRDPNRSSERGSQTSDQQRQMERERQARESGQQRYQNHSRQSGLRSSGGSRGGGGRGGGGRGGGRR